MQLKITTRTRDGVTIVDCIGRIVFGDEAAALREVIKGLLPSNKNIIINLREVTYIDSGGLGTLVGLYTSAHAAKGDIRLANLTNRVTELLQVTKLLTVFETYPDEESAIRSYYRAAAV